MRLYEQAVAVPGPVTDAVSSAAREHGVVVVLGVNERDHGSIYNAQLVFDADGSLLLKRRKITPTYHERMVWGQGDASGLRVVERRSGRVGALACWEHYNPLARYALMAQHEQIHASQFPGSMVGQIFADQMEVTIRHHALESGCFVVNATGWLTRRAGRGRSRPAGSCRRRSAAAAARRSSRPKASHLCPPIREGEGMAIADLDLALITKRKRMMDQRRPLRPAGVAEPAHERGAGAAGGVGGLGVAGAAGLGLRTDFTLPIPVEPRNDNGDSDSAAAPDLVRSTDH